MKSDNVWTLPIIGQTWSSRDRGLGVRGTSVSSEHRDCHWFMWKENGEDDTLDKGFDRWKIKREIHTAWPLYQHQARAWHHDDRWDCRVCKTLLIGVARKDFSHYLQLVLTRLWHLLLLVASSISCSLQRIYGCNIIAVY